MYLMKCAFTPMALMIPAMPPISQSMPRFIVPKQKDECSSDLIKWSDQRLNNSIQDGSMLQLLKSAKNQNPEHAFYNVILHGLNFFPEVYGNSIEALFDDMINILEKRDVKSFNEIISLMEDRENSENMNEKLKCNIKELIVNIISLLDVLLNMNKYLGNFEGNLAPKLLLCNDNLVNHLVDSKVGNYVEFKTVDRLIIIEKEVEDNNEFLKTIVVPTTKEDVFTDKSISLLDKRRLTKILSDALEYKDLDTQNKEDNEENHEFHENKFKLFDHYLESFKFKDSKIKDYIKYGIIGTNVTKKSNNESIYDKLSFEEGMVILSRFVKSLGKWGKTAYLASSFGLYNELVQAFCRNAAVFGATYLLNFRINSLKYNKVCNETTGESEKDEIDGFTLEGTLKGFADNDFEEEENAQKLTFESPVVFLSLRLYSLHPHMFNALLYNLGHIPTNDEDFENISSHRTGLIFDGDVLSALCNTEDDINKDNDISLARIIVQLENKESNDDYTKEGLITLVQIKAYNNHISNNNEAANDEYDYSRKDFYYVYLIGDININENHLIEVENLLLKSKELKDKNIGLIFGYSIKEVTKRIKNLDKSDSNEKDRNYLYNVGNNNKLFIVDDLTNGDDFSNVSIENSITLTNNVINVLNLSSDIDLSKQLEKDEELKLELKNKLN